MLLPKSFSWYLLLFLSTGLVVYNLIAYGSQPLGNFVHPEMKTTYLENTFGIYLHIFAASLSLLLGPFQFSSSLREKNPGIHRLLGKIYLFIGVAIGGLAGLYMAQLAFGGLISQFGFSLLSILWLFTGFMAFRAIRKNNILEHRRWMISNFALTFAAVTLRVEMGIFYVLGFSFEEIYPLLAWISWVPNILIAEWLINRTIPAEVNIVND